MAPHSSTLAWKIPWMEEPGRLQSMGSLRVGHDWVLHFHFSLSCIGEGNGNPLQCSCLENPRDRGAWWAAAYGVTQSRTRLKWLSSSSSRTIFRIILSNKVYCWLYSQRNKNFTSFLYLLCDPRPARPLCPWNSPGKNTGVGSHSFLWGSSVPGFEPGSMALQTDSLLSGPPVKPSLLMNCEHVDCKSIWGNLVLHII